MNIVDLTWLEVIGFIGASKLLRSIQCEGAKTLQAKQYLFRRFCLEFVSFFIAKWKNSQFMMFVYFTSIFWDDQSGTISIKKFGHFIQFWVGLCYFKQLMGKPKKNCGNHCEWTRGWEICENRYIAKDLLH